jgi:integrase
MKAHLLRVSTGKTGVIVILPIHPDFAGWLESIPRGIGKASVFPDLANVRISGTRGLSDQFSLIVEKAGISRRVTAREGKGRTTSSKTFHSLRHFCVSQLANAGVAPEVRQRIVGHSDSKTHAVYTHHEARLLSEAVAKLPSIAGR